MNTFIYFRNLSDVDKISSLMFEKINGIVCGDYGCSKALPEDGEVIKVSRNLKSKNWGMHYISPKVTLATIDDEEIRILKFLNEGISVSINDWGLMYRLRNKLKAGYDVYIGRLLTKSIADWTWAPIFFEKEHKESVLYLSQNNFNHKHKIAYFKEWGIKGVEINVHKGSEASYEKIKELGFDVIGFADNTVLAVSRACPISKIYGSELSTCCRENCLKKYEVFPANDKQRNIYPDIELWGNVLYGNIMEEVYWSGFSKLVFTWTSIKK